MRKKALIIFVFTFTFVADLQSKPNLQETMSWIIGKLEGYYTGSNSNPSFQNLKYDYNKNMLCIRRDGNNDPTFEIPLKEINPYNIEVEVFESRSRGGLCGNIKLSTVERKGVITANYSDESHNFKMSGFTIVIPENILRSEPDLPERLKKAFKSAIELLTGKSEAF